METDDFDPQDFLDDLAGFAPERMNEAGRAQLNSMCYLINAPLPPLDELPRPVPCPAPRTRGTGTDIVLIDEAAYIPQRLEYMFIEPVAMLQLTVREPTWNTT